MRLFTGIALPDAITANLTRLIEHLRNTAHIRWSAPYNLHITTKFVGNWPDERLPEMIAALRSVSNGEPFEVAVRGFGWFPNPHRPRIFFIGVHAPPALAELAKATNEATVRLGVAKEETPFSTHLTLARVTEGAPLGPLRRAVADMKSDEFGTFMVDRYHLYSSKPGPTGSIYTQLAEFPLTQA